MKEKEKLASKSKLTPGSLLQGQLVKHPFPPLDYEEDPFKLKEQKPGYEDNAGALTVPATDPKSRKKGSRDHKPRLKVDEFQGGQGVQRRNKQEALPAQSQAFSSREDPEETKLGERKGSVQVELPDAAHMYNANDYQHLKSKFAKAKSNTQRDLIADQKRGSLKPKDSEKIIMNTLALQKRLSTQVVLPSQMGSEEANQLKLQLHEMSILSEHPNERGSLDEKDDYSISPKRAPAEKKHSTFRNKAPKEVTQTLPILMKQGSESPRNKQKQKVTFSDENQYEAIQLQMQVQKHQSPRLEQEDYEDLEEFKSIVVRDDHRHDFFEALDLNPKAPPFESISPSLYEQPKQLTPLVFDHIFESEHSPHHIGSQPESPDAQYNSLIELDEVFQIQAALRQDGEPANMDESFKSCVD